MNKFSQGYPAKRLKLWPQPRFGITALLTRPVTRARGGALWKKTTIGLITPRAQIVWQASLKYSAGLGFQQCRNSSLESGFEKVALYEEQGLWTHAALQTPTGRWRSKLGQGPLIEHLSPESLSDGIYGIPTVYMRKVCESFGDFRIKVHSAPKTDEPSQSPNQPRATTLFAVGYG